MTDAQQGCSLRTFTYRHVVAQEHNSIVQGIFTGEGCLQPQDVLAPDGQVISEVEINLLVGPVLSATTTVST